MTWTDVDPLGRPRAVIKGRAAKRLYYVMSNGDLKYGEIRTKRYTRPSEAARQARELLNQGRLAAIAYQDTGPMVQGGLSQLLKDAKLERLEDAK